MKFIINRLKEPSTWAGVSALGVLVGVPPGTLDLVAQVGVGLAGLLAIALKDKGNA